ncbi:hypothetical protein D3Z51_00145 [Clostridiaceae bacterium]|nr:hypothetical protein [Clostridiaceae bacterium]RKI16542.1 hypothetical protein D7V81_04765 [bacterium 1XD21-70]
MADDIEKSYFTIRFRYFTWEEFRIIIKGRRAESPKGMRGLPQGLSAAASWPTKKESVFRIRREGNE